MDKFYKDGLKDCSWIPNTFEEFKVYASTKHVLLYKTYMIIYTGDRDFKYIDTIYVLKNFRNRGIATTVLSRFSTDRRTIVLCNKKLVGFYKKLGYTEEVPYAIMVKDDR